MKRFLSILAALCLLVGSSYAVDVAPVLNASLSGGQNTFKGDTSSFSGNLNLNIIPALKYSDKFSLIPMYNLEYREIKQVKELADGNILFQKGLSHNIAIKPIWSLKGDMKLRLRAGYMIQQLKEAASEDLSSGAFNYSKITAGAEIANGDSYSVGINMYSIAYPNYGDLVAKNPAFSVVATSAPVLGNNILDFTAYELLTTKKLNLSNSVILDATLDYTIKQFGDQKTASDISTVSGTKRSDNALLINLFPSMAIVPTGPTTMFGGLSLNYVNYTSNQNYADPKGPKFTSNYYNYGEIKIAPIINLAFNKIPLKVGITYEMAMRNYSDRLTQDVNGNYTADKMYINTTYLMVTASYPVLENLNIFLTPSMLTSTSNMKYESVYQYNYDASSIFAGVNYSFE
ncbi:MAG: hypothetical protein LHV68_05475 [Elusimicrobia bacterium]|nr:hypothetical protein [Candidatus Liberimonas magnetica]